jgi:hypothetical protein
LLANPDVPLSLILPKTSLRKGELVKTVKKSELTQ